jgi:hypothetical protein
LHDNAATHRQILLVGENQEKGVPQLVLVEHALQLLTSLGDTVTIVAVDDEDDALGVLEVVSPQRPNLVLATDIPHGELDVAVLDGLDVETCLGVSLLARRVWGTSRAAIAQRLRRGGGGVPMVGMVVTTSPNLSLYRMVVFPAASRPTIRMRISFCFMSRESQLHILDPPMPIFAVLRGETETESRGDG